MSQIDDQLVIYHGICYTFDFSGICFSPNGAWKLCYTILAEQGLTLSARGPSLYVKIWHL